MFITSGLTRQTGSDQNRLIGLLVKYQIDFKLETTRRESSKIISLLVGQSRLEVAVDMWKSLNCIFSKSGIEKNDKEVPHRLKYKTGSIK